QDVSDNLQAWPRARCLHAILMTLVGDDAALPLGSEPFASGLLNQLALYSEGALGDYLQARRLIERSLAMTENVVGPEHPSTAVSLCNLASLVKDQGDLQSAQ